MNTSRGFSEALDLSWARYDWKEMESKWGSLGSLRKKRVRQLDVKAASRAYLLKPAELE